MRGPGVTALLLFLSFAIGASEPPNVRPLDGISRRAFDTGYRQSASFRALVDELEASDVIVHVVTVVGLPVGLSGELRFVAGLDDARHVRIHLDWDLSPRQRIAALAHELQHACELARSDAATTAEFRALFEAIGTQAFVGNAERYETPAARETGKRVLIELANGGDNTLNVR